MSWRGDAAAGGSLMPSFRARAATSSIGGLLILIFLNTGCGAFAVEDGLFPLPTIHIVWPIPGQFGLAAETRILTSANGGAIYGWYIPAEDPRATVLIHHGAVTNRSVTFEHYQLLHRHHYNVFVYDYQGFGESFTLARITTVLPDADAALAHLQESNAPGDDKIILFGQSMGTLPAIAQAARSPDRVVGVVLEGSFAETLPTWAYTLLGVAPDPVAFDRIPDELNPVANIVNVTISKRFIQSVDDRTTPIDGARSLYQMAPDPKSFIESTGSHLTSVTNDPNYEARLVEYLDAVTGG